MSIFPIGGMKPVARRLILKVYTDAGVVGYGEGTGGGAGLFRQGLADLVIGEHPFMVGRVWEKLFAITYSRELATRGWSRTDLISAMTAIDAALRNAALDARNFFEPAVPPFARNQFGGTVGGPIILPGYNAAKVKNIR
jgi:hypothetical protein